MDNNLKDSVKKAPTKDSSDGCKGRHQFVGVIGKSLPMLEIAQRIEKISKFKTTVLISGESGTGKELVARYLHQTSPRKNKPFIPINCGAIPEHLMESELFGHKKGSFTDATRDKKGLFEEASGGTIFLDEIGELPLHLQAKLLRVLQEGSIRPVGSEQDIAVDLRVIAATLRNLEDDSMNGRFRDDLYYRLHVLELRIPPLRERIVDLPDLVNFLCKKICRRLNLDTPQVSEEAMAAFTSYAWPGNIRELENYLERAIILSNDGVVGLEELPAKVLNYPASNAVYDIKDVQSLSIKEHTREIERILIKRALAETKGNKTHAAKLLEISHRTLLYKLKEYNFS